MPRLTPARRLIYDKVLLAVYVLADEVGLTCSASCEAIGRQASVTGATARRYLDLLGEDGVIDVRSRGPALPRLCLLQDHPDHLDTIITVDGGLGDDAIKELPPPAF